MDEQQNDRWIGRFDDGRDCAVVAVDLDGGGTGLINVLLLLLIVLLIAAVVVVAVWLDFYFSLMDEQQNGRYTNRFDSGRDCTVGAVGSDGGGSD